MKCTPGDTNRTYWWEQHLHISSIWGLHEHVRLVIGKLQSVEMREPRQGKVGGRRAHIEHLPCEPDRVRRAYEVFDPCRVDARGHRFVRHL